MFLSSIISTTLEQSQHNPALHIPDGFLSIGISLVFWVLTVGFLSMAVRNSREVLGERQIPLIGVIAAFIFAGQMINFPVAGGTSGHVLGGTLAAIVLGPWAGILAMASVVGLQGLLFQDGGLVVMGANIFNMGVLTVLVGYGLYRITAGKSRTVKLAVAAVGAWLSVMAAALATSLQLWLSGTSPLTVVLPAMLGVHALVGIGEAIITVAALAFIMQTRPNLLVGETGAEKGGRGWIVAGFAIALAMVLFSPLASANPDGLERVAKDIGFLETGIDAPYGILPGYTLPFLGETALSTVVAGLVGALMVAAVAAGALRLLGGRKTPKASRRSSG